MDIILSNGGDKPIYEQISSQLRGQIMAGSLAAGERLPSIRSLANDLGVSVITTKRAYSDLEAEGLIETVPGKGCFVSAVDPRLLRERRLREIEGLLENAAKRAAGAGIGRAELHEMLDLVMPGSFDDKES